MKESKGIGERSQIRVDWFLKEEELDHTPLTTTPNIKQQIKYKKKVLRGDLQDGGGVRRGDHLPPQKYIYMWNNS